MPLIYRQRRENAFKRLQDGIDKVSKRTNQEGLFVSEIEQFATREELAGMKITLRGVGSRRTMVLPV